MENNLPQITVIALLSAALLFVPVQSCRAQSGATAQRTPVTAEVSPKKGWGDFDVVEEDTELPLWHQLLLWPVNRVFDLWDIFRVDAGAGLATGGVVRITEYGQAGLRTMRPASLRIGAFGRKAPWLMERSNEFGIGPSFVRSKDRQICTGEIGVGVDLFIVGGYGGICVEELFDFALGLVLLDPRDDDFR